MFVLLLKIFLERTELKKRCLLFGSLLLLVHAVHGGGYQRTRDGRTLVWNNFPSEDDAASWTGKRDAEGYATGSGTLTWYRTDQTFQTGSLLPAKAVVVVTRYSGTMVRGRLNGPVVNTDPDGKTHRFTFVNGTKAREQRGQSVSSSEQRRTERVAGDGSAPAEGPGPSPVTGESVKKTSRKETTAEYLTNTQPATAKEFPSPSAEKPSVEVASIRPKPIPAAPSSSSDEIDPVVKDRIIADFKEETEAVLSQVAEATDNFRGVDQLSAVGSLPASVSEKVTSLNQRARDFRSKVGYETALRDYRKETETVDALAAIEQVTRNIAANDASAANAKLTEFLKSNPEPSADSQKGLWQYLTSTQQLCARLEKDAGIHLQRAESFAAASRTSDAIREYQEAYRIFPNPAAAEKIRQLQASSLGL